MGGGWQGGGWLGGGWQGGGWQGGGWQGGGGGVPTFAMRADKPFADFAVPLNDTARYPDFPKRYWDPDLWALTILPEFFTLPKINAADPHPFAWQNITLPAPAPITAIDIGRMLILAVTERPEALGEIIQQDQNLQLSWLQLLMMDASTHPCTFLLMKLAARVGETMMMVLKRQFDRPRPSQVSPNLFPPVAVPGHGSYPAGHALIGRLTSICLDEVVPNRTAALMELARRAGFNRVIAGLHYESDVIEGYKVADRILPLLNLCPTYTKVKNELVLRSEWVVDPLPPPGTNQ
ncbi:phosphatase PAP2 family protein [Bradyrhizobium rifense]|uniref:Phosphatase PAP2 family protein n=1 Tax=Bradyrhizobium rifense TaxID=515499 RepID=A0A5D3KTQ4_9BRAD|nr:phosphatase PAP2 family protein [Bradyrhizobium rifense]TYL95940.1 phosphatase PAP2 family protein [Bradyrhizobium rifense]